MDLWAAVVVAAAAVIAAFVVVMGFRGLMAGLERSSGGCVGCGRTTLLPLPVQGHRCWRCRPATKAVEHLFAGLLLPRH